MGNRAIHVTQTSGDTDGLREFANGADSGIILPQGITSERESGATAGTIRYNTTTTAVEYTTGSDAWVTVGEVSTLNDISNVTITSAASGQFLKWNGSAWINAVIDPDADIDINSATDGTSITVDSDNDLVLLYDADAAAVKKVKTGQIATPTKLNSATIFFAANG